MLGVCRICVCLLGGKSPRLLLLLRNRVAPGFEDVVLVFGWSRAGKDLETRQSAVTEGVLGQHSRHCATENLVL